MTVLITGSTGLIGSALVSSLLESGHQVRRLVRTEPRPDGTEIRWDPQAGTIDAEALEGLEAAVHLAGESIVGGRWTEQKKARIRDSRALGTHLLAETLAGLQHPPRVLVSASGVDYYGNRGDARLDETSPPGSDFLAETCLEWEAATEPAGRKDIRVVHLRTGMVLSAEGGALPKMLLPFKLGLGGVLGDGTQYLSWVSLPDLVGIVRHALDTEDLRGPVNAVSPNPVTNREFTRTLARVLGRPAFFSVPAFAARLVFGEMADDLLLSSTRVDPVRLRETGYVFRHPNLEDALRAVL